MNYRVFAAISVLVLLPLNVLQASAQQGFDILGEFSGKGFKAMLPDDWVGRQLDENSVMAVPTEYLSPQTQIEMTTTVGYTQLSGWEWIEANTYVPGCIISSASFVELEAGIAKMIDAECEASSQWPFSILKIHEFLNSGENEGLIFSITWATTEQVFAQHMQSLEEMIGSFEIESPSDIREIHAELYGLKSQDREVTVNGTNVTLVVQSASEIQSLFLDEQAKILSFISPESHSAGMFTILPIRKVLEGPYTVMVDGQPLERTQFHTIEDEIDNESFIAIRHGPNQEIQIQGTRVIEPTKDNPQTHPDLLTGEYQWGDIDLKFPAGWHAVETGTQIQVFPEGFVPGNSSITDLKSMGLTIMLPTISETTRSIIGQMGESCEKPEISYVEVNGVVAKRVVENCDVRQPDLGIQSHSYWFGFAECCINENQVVEQAIRVQYLATDGQFETGIDDFMSLVNSLDLGEASSDIRPIEYRVSGMSSTTETVAIDENQIEVKIDSNTQISDFNLNEESKSISFMTEGEDGTEGTTVVNISPILEGPYTVAIDGQVTEDVTEVTDETSGETFLVVSYRNSVHEITISGTQVVPELGPLSMVILAISIISALIGLHVNRHSL